MITVSELMQLSPFEDVKNNCEEIEYIKRLLERNHTIGYRNNTFQPDRHITTDEFMIMATKPELFREKRALSYKDMVSIAKENSIKPKNATGNALLEIALSNGIDIDELKLKDKKKVKRIEAIELICKLSEKI